MAADPDLARLRQRVDVITEDTIGETASDVVLRLVDGREMTVRHDLDAPIPLESRTQRLRDKARALLGANGEAELWQAVHGSDQPDLGALASAVQSLSVIAARSRESA